MLIGGAAWTKEKVGMQAPRVQTEGVRADSIPEGNPGRKKSGGIYRKNPEGERRAEEQEEGGGI